MQRPKDLQQSQNDSFYFEQVQDGFGAVSSCAILLPDIDMTGDINCFQPGQMMSRSSKVSVTSMLTCLLHPPSISPPAPFHPWTKQTYIITGLFPCLKHASLSSGYCGTQELSYFRIYGWVKGIPSLIIFKKRCKAFLPADGGNSKALFDIRVDMEWVSIKWISILC